MRSSKRKTALTWLLILIALPWPLDYWNTTRQRHQDQRDDELYEKYDCSPVVKCDADFNGDGIPSQFDVVPCDGKFWGCLIVLESGKEVLRLPYNGTDGTFRTHLAVLSESGKSRLLIYDGASHNQVRKSVFEWDSDKLSEAPPNSFESEIINAMAAHDDTGGWNGRFFRGLARIARFVGYYLLLFVFVCVVWWWGESSSPIVLPPHKRDFMRNK